MICTQARPEVAWLGTYLQQTIAGIPYLEWFVRPVPDALDITTAKRSIFW